MKPMYVYCVSAKNPARNFQFEGFVLAENENQAIDLGKKRLEECFISFFKLNKIPHDVDLWSQAKITTRIDTQPRVLKFGWDSLHSEASVTLYPMAKAAV